jgi:hypothetical protein
MNPMINSYSSTMTSIIGLFKEESMRMILSKNLREFGL